MGYVPPPARDDRNVWYPRQPPRGGDRPDPNGCVAAIALIAMCAACFWYGMWLGSQHPASQAPVEATP